MSKEFIVKKIVEPQNGRIHRRYTYNRRPCKRVLLDSRLCQQLAGYALIEKDLRSISIWMDEIDRLGATQKALNRSTNPDDRKTFNLVKGLFVAALTFYGKCFSKCEGRPVKLERRQLDEKYRELHDECILYRHNFAAHSGAKRIERVNIALVFPAKPKAQMPFQIFKELDQPDVFWPAAGEVAIQQLVQNAKDIALAKIALLSKKIADEEIIPNSKIYWGHDAT